MEQHSLSLLPFLEFLPFLDELTFASNISSCVLNYLYWQGLVLQFKCSACHGSWSSCPSHWGWSSHVPVRELGVAVVHVAGFGVAATPVFFSLDPDTVFSPCGCWVVLRRTWLAWASPQNVAVIFVPLEQSGRWYNSSKYLLITVISRP